MSAFNVWPTQKDGERERERERMIIGGHRITHLEYADDIALMAGYISTNDKTVLRKCFGKVEATVFWLLQIEPNVWLLTRSKLW